MTDLTSKEQSTCTGLQERYDEHVGSQCSDWIHWKWLAADAITHARYMEICASAWHRALQAIATILEVDSNADYPDLQNQIAEAIQRLRSSRETIGARIPKDMGLREQAGECGSNPIEQCKVPPAGWRCTREAGHEGPCAAIPCETAAPLASEPFAGSVNCVCIRTCAASIGAGMSEGVVCRRIRQATVRYPDAADVICTCGKRFGEHPIQPPWWPCMVNASGESAVKSNGDVP